MRTRRSLLCVSSFLHLLLDARRIQGWGIIPPQTATVRAGDTTSMSSALTPPRRSSSASPSANRSTTRWEKHLDLARSAHKKRHWPQVRELCSRVISISDDWDAVEQAHLRLALAEQKDMRVDAARRAFQHGTAACPSSDTLFMAWALMESKMSDARSRKVALALLRRAVALNPSRHASVLKWRGVFVDLQEVGEAAVEAVRSALSPGPATTPRAPCCDAAGATGAPQPVDLLNRLGGNWAEEREHKLAGDLLQLCREFEADAARSVTEACGKSVVTTASCFKDLLVRLEKSGRGVADGCEGEGRTLSGTWRLVFTTCSACDKALTRTGSEAFQRLTPPMKEIVPRAGEPPVPLKCELLVRTPSSSRSGAVGKESIVSSFFRGRADARKRDGGRVFLRQQVAPRTAKRCSGSSASRVRRSEVSSPAVFSALGHVSRGKQGLERLVTQEVTYVGRQLRVARTRDGDVYVYERCAWPQDA